MKIKSILKNLKFVRNVYRIYKTMNEFYRFKPLLFIKKIFWFYKSYLNFKNCGKNENFNSIEFYPCLFDKTSLTPIEPVYFFQDAWAARHISIDKPSCVYDIGSSVKTMSIIASFVPVIMVDIRPPEANVENLSFIKGDILKLPFKDNSIDYLTSLCVVEHIGLGRYGDTLNPFGSEKAIKELKRVLKVGGVILLSVPVDAENKIYFNAHRAFSRDYILELLNNIDLLDEKYIYGNRMYDFYDKAKGFGTGLFKLKKGEN